MTPTILYYECLDNTLDGSYQSPLDPYAKDMGITIVKLDSHSTSDQLTLAQRAIHESNPLLLVVDSRKGSNEGSLFALINTCARKKGALLWLGKHPLAQKTIKMTGGEHVDDQSLLPTIQKWFNQC